MSTPPPPPLDVVSLAIALFSLVFSASAAQVIGPYAVIIVAAIGGASMAAADIAEATTGKTLRHVLLWTGASIMLTVPTAELAARWTGVEIRWLFAPIAALIAWHPGWAVERARTLLDWFLGRRMGGPSAGDRQGDQP